MIETLEIDSVILEFGSKRVLQDIYIKCETGKVTGLLGRNGTGKTCLMNIIYGQLTPYDYSVRLNGKSLLTLSRKPFEIMYLPQFSFIPKSLIVKRIFNDFGLDFSGFTIDFPDFEKYYHSIFHKLSGGEQRIVEIYIIIASRTKFCLLDEPFSQVMPIHVDSIKKLIVREKETKGILITDHLFEHVLDISDDLYVIADGKTLLTVSMDDIVTLGYVNVINTKL